MTGEFDFEVLRLDEVSGEMEMVTFGWSRRRARRHAPLVKMWWSSVPWRGGLLASISETAACFRLRRRERVEHASPEC